MAYVPDPDGMVQFQIDRRRELAAGAPPATGIEVQHHGSTTAHLNLTTPLPHVPPAMCICGGYIMADGRCTKCGTLTPGWKR